jgi:uncharacterized membrane-anchored protein YhcB (DUF1043 family)
MDGLGLAVIAFGLGVAAALALRWVIGGPSARELELEDELEEERARRTAQQEAVEKHFEQTAQHFQELSYQHALLYRHLSEGMRELCNGREALLGPGAAPNALLEPEAEAPPRKPSRRTAKSRPRENSAES